MKKTLLSLLCLGVASMGFSQINSFPYSEDFEGGAGGWVADNTTNGTWELNTPGSTNITGAASGTAAWVTNAAGNYNTSENSWVLSPEFNFVGYNDPTFSMNIWWNSENSWDGTQLQYSTDNQATWVTVGALGDPFNWYTDNTISGLTYTGNQDGWTGAGGGYLNALHDLPGLGGQASVYFRVAFGSDASVTQDGVAFDDVLIEALPTVLYDLQTNSVDSIPAQFCADTLQGYTTVQQLGGDSIFPGDTLIFTYNDGTNMVMDSVILTDTILPGGSYQHMYSTEFDYTTPGNYDWWVAIEYSNDTININDTLMGTVVSIPVVASFPYVEDFENGEGGWRINNAGNGTWAFGTPAHAVMNSAASGDSAWSTGNLNGSYNVNENSWVESPCFDFTNATGEEWVSMNIWWESENSWDGANLTASTDGGNSWFLVGAFGDPFNWYNDNSISGGPGGSQVGWTGSGNPVLGQTGSFEWVSAKHDLDSATFAGNESVFFRVNFGSDGSVTQEGFSWDDFIIAYPPSIDYMPDSMVVCDTSFMFDVSADMWQQVDWSTGTQGDMEMFNMDGTYTITVTDSNNLCTTETFYLEFADYAAPNLGPDRVLCDGSMETLDAGADSVAYMYTWNDGSMMQTLDITLGGTYWVTKDDSVSGCSVTDSVEIYQPPVADLGVDTTLFCDGNTVTLDPGIAGGTYIWNTGDATQTVDATENGVYAVTVIDSLGCISLATTALVDDTPMPDLGDDFTMCLNHVITLDATYPGATYSWSTGGTGASEDIDGSALGAGNFTVTVDVTSATGCTGTADVEVTVDPCVGIGENIAGVAVNMFPNPTDGIVTVEVADENATNMTISVLNLQGQVISTEQYNNGNGVYVVTLDLTDVASGYYFVKFENENGVMMHQLVKQ